MLVSEKNAKNKICVSPDANINKFVSLPTQNPNASEWNIGCVGSLALGCCIGHVHFIIFVLISFASDTRRKPVFQWNMGFKRKGDMTECTQSLKHIHYNIII